MFALSVLIAILGLASANIEIKKDANVDIIQLQDELRRQGDLVDILLKRLDAQEHRINEQDLIIAKQAARISVLENRENILDAYLSKKGENKTVSNSDKRKSSITRKQSESLFETAARPQIRQINEGPIAFQATVNAANDVEHVGLGQKLIFNKVKLSIGGGYHSQHGIFIAPRAGLYLFSVSVQSSNHKSVEAALQKNGATLAGAYSSSINYDQGSVTVVTQLAIGDEVYVINAWPADTTIHTREFTSFMGYLLTEIY